MPSVLPHRKKGIDRHETELIWKDKRKRVYYDVLPFQTVEQLGLVGQQRLPDPSEPAGWVNRLIWGDNKLVMGALLEELRGKVNLIYIDPPFATGEDFSMRVSVGEERATAVKQPSLLEQQAYADMWGYGLDSYLQFMYDRLVLMRELLAENGALFVHLGSDIQHPVRLVLDEVFPGNYRNAIIVRRGAKNVQAQFTTIGALMKGYDAVLFYTRSGERRLPQLTERLRELHPGTWNNHWRGTDRPTMRYELFGITPTSGQWRWSKERTMRAVENYQRYLAEFASRMALDEYYLHVLETTEEKLNFVRQNPTSGRPEHYVPPRQQRLLNDLWLDISAYERGEFPTQKSEALLKRIIGWVSDEGDLVADFFCGSGTALAVAEKLGRRWIGCDLSKWAIHVTRKRMLDIEGVRPFLVQTLAQFPKVHFIGLDVEAQQQRASEYLAFILQLYRAEPVEGYQAIHGLKGGRYVHVGAPDASATEGDLRTFAEEIASLEGNRAGDALFWEMPPGLRDVAAIISAETGVDLHLRRIPKEVVQVKDPAREQIQFHELPILEVEVAPVEGKPRTVRVALKDFVTLDELPTEVKGGITHFADRIDYWAVDFDYRPPGFTNGWQSYRTRRDPSLQTECIYTYAQPGTYTVAVKVVDIFGNDTTWVGEVKVK